MSDNPLNSTWLEVAALLEHGPLRRPDLCDRGGFTSRHLGRITAGMLAHGIIRIGAGEVGLTPLGRRRLAATRVSA